MGVIHDCSEVFGFLIGRPLFTLLGCWLLTPELATILFYTFKDLFHFDSRTFPWVGIIPLSLEGVAHCAFLREVTLLSTLETLILAAFLSLLVASQTVDDILRLTAADVVDAPFHLTLPTTIPSTTSLLLLTTRWRSSAITLRALSRPMAFFATIEARIASTDTTLLHTRLFFHCLLKFMALMASDDV